MTLIIFILVLGIIIFVHELGHFLFAKLAGVYVYEFSLGMGPRILHKKGKETDYCLRLIPIGGFCSMAGEELDEETIKVPKNRRLQAKKPWQRFLIMFFGPGFNFIFAILTLFFVALIFGATSYKPVVSSVQKNYPAVMAGISKGDTILEINNKKVKTLDDVSIYLTIANHKKTTKIEVLKKNKTQKVYNIKAKKIGKGENATYRYGLGLKSHKEYGFINAIKYTYIKTVSLFKQMFITLGSLFTGVVSVKQLSGPVGIYNIVGESSKAGISSILYLMAFLSINVGFLNLLPFPAFDGGHILFIVIEKIKGSPVNPKTENMIHSIGFFLLMALMLFVTFNDIVRLFLKS